MFSFNNTFIYNHSQYRLEFLFYTFEKIVKANILLVSILINVRHHLSKIFDSTLLLSIVKLRKMIYHSYCPREVLWSRSGAEDRGPGAGGRGLGILFFSQRRPFAHVSTIKSASSAWDVQAISRFIGGVYFMSVRFALYAHTKMKQMLANYKIANW